MTGTDVLTSENEADRYRAGVAHLLRKQIDAVGDSERWLDAPVDLFDSSAQAFFEKDPTGAFRTTGALFLRKARLHMAAMGCANENNNVHSLAVQMRPILECADQVVLVFHNLMIAPEHGMSVVHRYLNKDYYQAIIRTTKGKIGREQLLKMVSKASGMPVDEVVGKKRTRRSRKIKHADKMTGFEISKGWYNYLSENFRHDGPNWKGDSWRGGVNSINTVQDKLTFAALMDYLVNRVAVMNSYVALCPVEGAIAPERINATLAQLQEVRATTKALRNGVESTIAKPDEQGSDRMAASAPYTSRIGSEATCKGRAECERCRDLLYDLARIHLEIDAPTRRMQLDDPDWIGRLRKICLHVSAIKVWEIDNTDVEHMMATEIRAAYEQMDAVWKHLPEMFRLDVMEGGPWAEEARNGMLAVYDHPTQLSLMLPAGCGGLGNGKNSSRYSQLVLWMANLGLGYGHALLYLAQVLGVEADIETRVAEVFERIADSLS